MSAIEASHGLIFCFEQWNVTFTFLQINFTPLPLLRNIVISSLPLIRSNGRSVDKRRIESLVTERWWTTAETKKLNGTLLCR
jgi:hypothetical protein